ncbi:hypothetical protein [Psychrobacter sp. P11G3]|uniref:hypothetical protein n=1 Tax=Psychrobacter sp. P11G3 TaxID=1699623 RepID=UPI00070B3CA5|nr:hypothetical protein [Psychrobacter sp. P11G3]KRG36531.1 hypothetical protein AK824_05185 [Psychrobacter sp. P11G3]
MKSNTFNHSLLAVGVAAVMGISTGAMAETKTAKGAVVINNTAKASYSVDGVAQNEVESNKVTVNVSETGSFSLIAQNADGNPGDDLNAGLVVVPTGVAQFTHRLENLGNLTDTYTMALTNKTDDTKNFDLAATKVTYVVYKDNGTVVRTVADITGTAFTNTAIVLEKDEYAVITVNGKTTANVGGDTQNLTLTAKSTYLANKGTAAEATATNTDESITKLPVFSIVKSVSQTLDINNPDATAEYTITVKNDNSVTYAADAVGIKIIDNLPEGLKLVTSSLTAASITTTGSATKGTIAQNNKGFGSSATIDGFEITGVNLPVGQTITIKFKVQKDADETLAKSTVNHVNIEAPLGGGSNVTVIDSTDGTNGGENTNTYYPSGADTENENGTAPSTPGGDSTQPLTSNQRAVTLTGPTTREVPNTSTAATQAVHQTVITNTGRETEGANAGELKFKIEDVGLNANVEPSKTGNITLVYDKDGDPATTNDRTTATLPYNETGEYDIKSAFPAGIAPKGTVTISYNVVSTAAVTDTTENTKVTLIPGGTDKPVAPAPVVDTTSVKGVALVKSQALDATCSGNVADSAFSSSTTALEAEPGQCVVYKIVATNTFSSYPVTNLVISDLLSNFSAGATVQTISPTTLTGTGSTVTVAANNNNTSINTTVNPLAATNTATLKFSIKIKP